MLIERYPVIQHLISYSRNMAMEQALFSPKHSHHLLSNIVLQPSPMEHPTFHPFINSPKAQALSPKAIHFARRKIEEIKWLVHRSRRVTHSPSIICTIALLFVSSQRKLRSTFDYEITRNRRPAAGMRAHPSRAGQVCTPVPSTFWRHAKRCC